MKGLKLEGIIPAFVTPLKEDRSTVDCDAAARLAKHEIETGANGLYILGATGEGLALEAKERENLCEAVVGAVDHKKPVVCHVASLSFPEAKRLAVHAEKAGADAIASVPPFFFSYGEDDVYNYYKALAGAVNIPVIVYFHPSAAQCMSAKLIARIFEIDNVTGVKWSSSNYYEMIKLKDLTHGEMNIINGPDEMLVSGLAAGADAGIGSTYNVMLPEYLRLYSLFREGKVDEARAVQIAINRVIGLMIDYQVIPAVKHTLSLMGQPVGEATFPMRSYTDAEKAEIAQKLAKIGWQNNGYVAL